jgi:two-component system, chemotaxis family, CheB/CheR fusion protein
MDSASFPVVGIGASAGGIEAFRHFFDNMPTDSGMAFVVVLHLPPGHKSLLGEILRRHTAMPVIEAREGTRLEADHIYVPPPHTLISLTDGRLQMRDPAEGSERTFRPIDGFFDSLGSARREQSVGIILSGTGMDGALGLKAIKACGGVTIAQGSDGTAPQYEGMPDSAIATGAVDLIAPVNEIPGHLLRMKSAKVEVPDNVNDEQAVETARLRICTLLRTHVGHDFSGYRSQTFLRRVGRRMVMTSSATLDAYIAKLEADPAEATLLFRDLLIRVTSFFRDQETFEMLALKVVPRLFEGKMADATVRVWVPGCATGEEACSLAILLQEHMDTLTAPPRVQIFATDIDDTAIAAARLGRYPKTLVEGLSETRLRRFFTQSQGTFCITKEIRELCIFSVHNLVRDPPFSMMSLVSCRNLLIYMNTELQARVLPVFHYSLLPGGTLLLGGSESVAQHSNLFDTVDKAARIFQRRLGRTPPIDVRWTHARVNAAQGGTSANRIADFPHSAGADTPIALSMHRSPGTAGNRDPMIQIEHLLGEQEPSTETVVRLQTALVSIQEQLRSLSEEHQSALEELRSANEELHSVNEEMQSTNEELETSKEELQSLNEELHTVNLRLTEKIEELDHANSDLRNLFDSTELATVFLDRHLIVRSFTPAIASIYNLIPSDHGRALTDIVSRLRYQGIREDVGRVLSRLEPLERRVERDDLSAHYIMRILPYREPDCTVSGVLVTFVDVTSIVQAEAALVAADTRKDVFLATLSHELRNPLAPIRMAAQLLQSPDLPAGQLQDARNIIARQVTHMSSLLDDLLDVSRITRGSLVLKKSYVDLEEVIDDAVEAARAAIDAKHHTLRVEYPPVPIQLEVDPVRITQVVTNLLTNAAKYTPPGGHIHVGIALDEEYLNIHVRDNGVGLRPEQIATIFDMFTRVDSELGRTEGGLGIGLALAKGFVELHGGRLEVQSDGEDRGSEFLIRLPRSLVMEQAVVAPHLGHDSGSQAPRSILVADDNRDSADTIAMLLRLSGHVVHVAHNGKQALELANQVHPDIGIFDIGMPDMSGYELAERIRHEAWGRAATLIALTGWGQDADRRHALAAGFHHHLIKPVDPDVLEGLFNARTDTDH